MAKCDRFFFKGLLLFSSGVCVCVKVCFPKKVYPISSSTKHLLFWLSGSFMSCVGLGWCWAFIPTVNKPVNQPGGYC